MDPLLTRSKKELTRLEVIQRLAGKCLKQQEATDILGVSPRHVRRLLRLYRQTGEKGLVSRRPGQSSNNRLWDEVKQQAIDLLDSRYPDFEPTLAHEKLSGVHKLRISPESVSQVMIAEGLWNLRKVKRKAVHQMRPRRACLGELVQVDGSPQAWFEDRECPMPAVCGSMSMMPAVAGWSCISPLSRAPSATFNCHRAESGISMVAPELSIAIRTAFSKSISNRPSPAAGWPNLDGQCRPWTSKSSLPTPHRPKAGSSGPTIPSKTGWSKNCACKTSQPSRQPTPLLPSTSQVSIAASRSSPAATRIPIGHNSFPRPNLTKSSRSKKPAPFPKT